MPVATREALELAVRNIGLPAVLKTRRRGYHGKGQAVLRKPEDLDAAWARLGGQARLLEAFVLFDRALSCLAVRGKHGEVRFYPVVEHVRRDGILRVSRPPPNEHLH